MGDAGFPDEVVEAIKDSIDCNLYFFDDKVEVGVMYAILCVTVVALIGVYVLINGLKKGR